MQNKGEMRSFYCKFFLVLFFFLDVCARHIHLSSFFFVFQSIFLEGKKGPGGTVKYEY